MAIALAGPLSGPLARLEALERTIAAIPMAVVVTDLEGCVELWSDAAAELYGWSEDEAVGRAIQDLLMPEAHATEAAEAAEIMLRLQSGRRWSGTLALRRKDGSTFEGYVVDAPVLDDDGEVTGIVGLSVDTTASEVARAEQDLRQARYRGIVDTSKEGIWMVDAEARTIYANPRMAELLGCPPQDLAGASVVDFMDDAGQQRATTIGARIAAGEPQQFEFHFVRPDGSDLYAELSTTPLLDEAGQVDGALAMVLDVSERRATLLALQESEYRFRQVFDESPLPGALVGPDHGIMRANRALARMLRTTREALEGRRFDDITHPDDLAADRAEAALLFAGQVDSYELEKRFIADDGSVVIGSLTCGLVRDEHGEPRYAVGLVEDITAAVEAEKERLEAAEVHRRTVEASHDAFIGVDAGGRITEWNPAAEQLLGWPAEEVLGRSLVEVAMPSEDRALYAGRIGAVLDPGRDEGPADRVELLARSRDGRVFPVEASLARVEVGGERQLRAFVRDISERRAYERELTDRVLIDQLTGLPNRTLMVDRFERALGRIGGRSRSGAVLFLDIDRFEVVNQRLGHSMGDRVLAAVAARLRDVVRADDTVARHGGDEFIVLCEDLEHPEDAARAAQRVLDAFDRPLAVGNERLTVGLSIGVAHITSSDAAPDALLRDADIAMHQAKALGRDRYVVFDDSLRAPAGPRLDLEHELRRALEEGEVTLAYQPVVTLDGRMSGFEALARWEHPGRGAISPAEFIPLAEETGLVVELGRQVLDAALAQVAEWRRRPDRRDFVASVNLSGRQLIEPDLVDLVDGALRRHGLPPEALCLEITESMLMEESSLAAATVDRLADLGVLLAVDDFGTGYSSLLYLRRFPVHALKLDRCFVAGLGENDADWSIVGSMVRLAHDLGLVAVAEGVEEPEHVEALRAHGCDQAQGFHWSPPVPADAFEALLEHPRLPVERQASGARR